MEEYFAISRRNLLPGLIEETLNIELELLDKYQRRQPLWPLEAVKSFDVIYRE